MADKKKFLSKKSAVAALVAGLTLGLGAEAIPTDGSPEAYHQTNYLAAAITEVSVPTDIVLEPAAPSATTMAWHSSHSSHSSHASHASHASHYSSRY